MIERINLKLDEWHETKPEGMLARLGIFAGAGAGFIGGVVYDAYKIVPTLLEDSISMRSLDAGVEGAVVLGMATVLGGAICWRAGVAADNFIEEPPIEE